MALKDRKTTISMIEHKFCKRSLCSKKAKRKLKSETVPLFIL